MLWIVWSRYPLSLNLLVKRVRVRVRVRLIAKKKRMLIPMCATCQQRNSTIRATFRLQQSLPQGIQLIKSM